MKHPRFRSAEEEYVRIKQAFTAGRITTEECEKALEELMIEHEGRHWMLGANTAKWYVWDGQAWTESKPPEPTPMATTVVSGPPPVSPPPVAPAKTPAHKFVLGCLLGCASPLLLVIGVVVIVRTFRAGSYNNDLGMSFVAAGVFLFALCVVGLLPKVPLPVFIVLFLFWTLAGFIGIQMNFRLLGYGFLPDHVFATGIVGLIGTFAGAGVRAMVKPK